MFAALFSTSDMDRLAKEISTMLSFEHTNVMSLVGVCIDGELPLLIMPFMSNGCVLEFVKHNKEKLLCINATELKVEAVFQIYHGITNFLNRSNQQKRVF